MDTQAMTDSTVKYSTNQYNHDNTTTKEYKFKRIRMFEDKEREELKEIINEVLDEREKRYKRDDDSWLYRGTY